MPQPAARRVFPSFWIKPALLTALVGMADQVFFQRQVAYGWLGLFGAMLVAAALLALPAVRRDRRALLAAGVALAMAGAMVWDAAPLPFLLFWIALGMAILLPATARFDDGWRWAQRLVAHGFKALFGPLIDFYKLGRARSKRPASRLNLRGSLPSLALPIVGSAIVIALFAAANPVIEGWLASLALPRLTERAFARVLFWSFVALVCWGVLRPRRSRPFFGTFDGSGDLAIPGVTPSSVLLSLALFNALFAVQNAMDMAWLWGLLPLPEGLTLAEYAHRGAYPLIVTALLSALFVLVTLRPGSATAGNPMIRRLVLIWLAQNVVLVASSMLRLFDYVDAYSMTRLRIAAFAWMALVMIGLALIAWRLVRGRSARWLINANCLAAAVLLTGYAFVDTGAIAARWNVDHAQEIDGSGAKLDVCYLAELGESALSALVAAERKPLPPIVAERVATARALAQHALAQRLKRGDWTLLGARRLAAAEAVGASTPKAWPASRTDCGGAPYGFD